MSPKLRAEPQDRLIPKDRSKPLSSPSGGAGWAPTHFFDVNSQYLLLILDEGTLPGGKRSTGSSKMSSVIPLSSSHPGEVH